MSLSRVLVRDGVDALTTAAVNVVDRRFVLNQG